MRLPLSVALLFATAAIPATAMAQATAPAPAPAPAAGATSAGGHYTTADTDLGTLLDDPGSHAVLQHYIPAMIANDQISMARGMTLRALQQYAGDTLTDVTLANIDRDLAALPAHP